MGTGARDKERLKAPHKPWQLAPQKGYGYGSKLKHLELAGALVPAYQGLILGICS